MFRFKYKPPVTLMPMYGCPMAEPETLEGDDAKKFLEAIEQNNNRAIEQDELEQLKKSYERLKDEKL